MKCVLDCTPRAPASSRAGRAPMGRHCSRTGRAPGRFFARDAGERRRGGPFLPRERGQRATGPGGAAALRCEGTLHLVRHRCTGGPGEGAHRARVRPRRGAFAVGGAQPLRAVDPAAGAPLVVPVGHWTRAARDRRRATDDLAKGRRGLGEACLQPFGDALRTILRKVDVALEKPAFNLFLHTMPLRTPENDFYHWHLDVKPVLTQQAGFEWASGCYINPTPPEEAASFLRQTEVFP